MWDWLSGVIWGFLARWREQSNLPVAPEPGATTAYAAELHDLGEREHLRSQLAQELGLDPLSPIDGPILEDAIALHLSLTERLRHFTARWEREVAPLVQHMGERFIGPLAPSGAVTASTFDGIRRQAHILALPAA